MSYRTKEELLNALAANIVERETDDGEVAFDFKNEDFEKEREYSRKQRNAKQKLQEEYENLRKERDELEATVRMLKESNPDELKASLESRTSELNALRKTNETLSSKLNEYAKRETTSRIENALLDEARGAGVMEKAFKDVKRLATNFQINADGEIVTRDGNELLRDAFAKELAVSDYWLARSRGGGASGNNSTRRASSDYESKLSDADRRDDVPGALSLIANKLISGESKDVEE